MPGRSFVLGSKILPAIYVDNNVAYIGIGNDQTVKFYKVDFASRSYSLVHEFTISRPYDFRTVLVFPYNNNIYASAVSEDTSWHSGLRMWRVNMNLYIWNLNTGGLEGNFYYSFDHPKYVNEWESVYYDGNIYIFATYNGIHRGDNPIIVLRFDVSHYTFDPQQIRFTNAYSYDVFPYGASNYVYVGAYTYEDGNYYFVPFKLVFAPAEEEGVGEEPVVETPATPSPTTTHEQPYWNKYTYVVSPSKPSAGPLSALPLSTRSLLGLLIVFAVLYFAYRYTSNK